MAGFCYFWRMTPGEYRALSIAESNAMFKHMDDVYREKKRAADRQAAANRRARRG